jgi:hypothetical protein
MTILRLSKVAIFCASFVIASSDGGNNKILRYLLTSKKQQQQLLRRELQTKTQIFDEQDIDGLYRGLGTHYVNLHVGCPSQVQTVIVDTGSTRTGFPCSECQDCGRGYHLNEFFEEPNSSCFETLSSSECHSSWEYGQCRASVNYAEGSSWSGYQVKDRVGVGGETLFEEEDLFTLQFTCQDEITGLFRTQLADGITGLSKSSSSLWGQMYAQGVIEQQQFSLCYRLEEDAQVDAGILLLGGTDTRLDGTSMVFAKEQQVSSSFWQVQIRKVYLRQESEGTAGDNNSTDNTASILHEIATANISESSLRPIVDSGTTSTYLNSALEKPLRALWAQLVPDQASLERVFYMTHEQAMQLPTIVFQLEGMQGNDSVFSSAVAGENVDPDHPNDILVAFPPSRYLQKTSSNRYALRIYFEFGRGVFGANFISGHNVLFDKEQGRIGFAESQCVLPEEDESSFTSPPTTTTTTPPPFSPTTASFKPSSSSASSAGSIAVGLLLFDKICVLAAATFFLGD